MAEIDALPQRLTDFEFWVAADCQEAMQHIRARGEVPTPAAVQRELDPEGNDPTITLELIEQGMAQVRLRWEDIVSLEDGPPPVAD